MTTGTLHGEFTDAISSLEDIKTTLVKYKQAHQDDNPLYQNAVVLETAIDGLLQKLTVPNLANVIDLAGINDLTDRLDHVKGRAVVMFASLHQAA